VDEIIFLILIANIFFSAFVQAYFNKNKDFTKRKYDIFFVIKIFYF